MRTLVRVVTAAMACVMRLLYGYHVEGLEHLPRHGPYLLLLNEISLMGSVAAALTVARLAVTGRIDEPAGVTVEDAMGVGPWRHIFRVSQVLTVPPGLGGSSAALWAGLRALRAGRIVVMNADGEMSWDGGPPPLRSGAAWLALRGGVPVVPLVSTQSAYEVWPRWARWPHASGRITVRVGPPLRLPRPAEPGVDGEQVEQANALIARQLHALVYS